MQLHSPEIAPQRQNPPFHSVPMFLQVEITSRCNLKCRMCPLTLGTTASSAASGQLAEADWDAIKSYAAVVRRVLLVGFGEPLTHPRFLTMLRELDELGVETSFSTNGIGAEAIVDELASMKHLHHVNISIDSPDPAIYKEIRGGDVERALTGMRAIASSLPDRVDVTVNSVVMKSNVRSLLEFPAILAEAGVRYYALNGLHDYTEELRTEHIYSGRKLQTFLPSKRLHVVMDQLKAECERRAVQLLLNQRTQLDFYRPDRASSEYFSIDENRPLTRACTVPFDSMYVDCNGEVYPCCHAAGHQSLGSLRTETPEQVWNGRSFVEFRTNLLDHATTPAVCRSCTVAPLGEHPFQNYQAEVTSFESLAGDAAFRVKVRNGGRSAWDRSQPLRIGTSRPRDRDSIHYHPSWLSPNRVAEMREDRVEPGGFATLEFELTPAHANRGETFQLLIEGQFWLPDTQFDLECPSTGELRLSLSCNSTVSAFGARLDLTVDAGPGEPWEVESDSDWLVPVRTAGMGSSVCSITAVPNWTCAPRVTRLRSGVHMLEIRQERADDYDSRLRLFCAWRLLRRPFTPMETAGVTSGNGSLEDFIVELLATSECHDLGRETREPVVKHVAEALFSSFLDQTRRSGRILGLTSGLEPHDVRSVVKRFFALTNVRALLQAEVGQPS